MIKIKTLLPLALFGLLGSTTLYANNYEDELFNPPNTELPSFSGIYGGVNVGMIMGSTGGGIGMITETDEVTMKAYAGYRYNELLGFEAAYHDLGDTSSKIRTSDGDSSTSTLTDANLSTTAMSIATLVHHPINDQLEIFGKAGFASWRTSGNTLNSDSSDSSSNAADVENSGVDTLIGIGANYDLDDNWSVRGEYERIGGEADANTVTVGANYTTF